MNNTTNFVAVKILQKGEPFETKNGKKLVNLYVEQCTYKGEPIEDTCVMLTIQQEKANVLQERLIYKVALSGWFILAVQL